MSKQPISNDCINRLKGCSNLAVKISKMEQEYQNEYALAVEYQKDMVIFMMILFMVLGAIVATLIRLILGAFIELPKEIIEPSGMTGVSGWFAFLMYSGMILGGPLYYTWFIVLQFKGEHHKVFMRLEKEISNLVKNEWIPEKKALDKIVENMDIEKYQNEYNNLNEIDRYLRSLKRWKKAAKQASTIGSQMLKTSGKLLGLTAIIGVGVAALATKAVYSAGSNIGSSSGYKTIERTEYSDGSFKEREL